MSRNTSIYLDLLRLLAAFSVFLDHSRAFVVPELPAVLASYGAEAVAVFFVLSGFVISYVAAEKEKYWKSYAIARISRIYPVALVAIIVTTIADIYGNHVNSDQYYLLNQQFNFYKPDTGEALIRYLTFTNQIWFSHFVYGTDEPYWSLGFEVWYYLLFGLIIFCPVERRTLIVCLAMLICGPKIVMYFPLWLLGHVAFKSLTNANIERRSAGLIWVASIFMLIVFVDKIFVRPTDIFHTWPPIQELKNLFYFYTIGIIVVVNIIAFDSFAKGREIWTAWQGKAIKWIAGASFTLYLAHQPLEVLICALYPDIGGRPGFGALTLVFILAVVFGLAELGERRKSFFKSLIRLLFYSKVAYGKRA